MFTVQRLLKALPHRERLLKGVREQAQRHRAKEKQQVDLVVERTKMGRRAGDAVAALTLPAAPAGAGRPGQWRPVADLAEGCGLRPGMYLFATAAFFDYDGNDLELKDRQGRVTTMYENRRQLLPCIKWSDVPGDAKPYGGVARDPELHVWVTAAAAGAEAEPAADAGSGAGAGAGAGAGGGGGGAGAADDGGGVR